MSEYASQGDLRKEARAARAQGWTIERPKSAGLAHEVWRTPAGEIALSTNGRTQASKGLRAKLRKAGLKM